MRPQEATHAPSSVPCTCAHTGGTKWALSAFKELVQLGEKSGGLGGARGKGIGDGFEQNTLYMYVYIIKQ